MLCSPLIGGYPNLDEDEKSNLVVVVTARYSREPELKQGLIEEVKEAVSGFATSGYIAKVLELIDLATLKAHAVDIN